MLKDISGSKSHSGMTRRQFQVGMAALSATSVSAQVLGQAKTEAKVKLGLIGCGGRGTWITKLFAAHGGYDIVAVADYFADRVKQAGETFGVASSRRYTGLSGYRRLLENGGVDAVAIESPPYFHPEQAAAAVQAGKHVYVAKPIAVDAPGCRSIEQSGKSATVKGLCFLIDFQTRADPFFIEAIKRVHDGAIGPFAFGEATYHAGVPWKRQIDDARSGSPESRLRAWGLDRVLSGDIITEQNIHTLDVASWIMNQPPECAWGTGGQKVRDFGTCWDTFSVVFRYPNNVGITFSSRQFEGYGTKPDGICNRMFGADGVLETKYGDQVLVRGKNFYRGGRSPGIFKDGAVANIANFHSSICRGDCQNPTVAPSVRSNLLTILGRTASYEGRVVTWKEIIESNARLTADFRGLED